MFQRIAAFIREARDELKKVTWPDRDEVTSFTMVVIISVILISLFLWLVDNALMSLVKLVLS